MKIKLAYGREGLSITLPDDLNVQVVGPVHVEALPDQAQALRRALLQPIASPPLKALVRPGHRVGIVVNDITRPTPYDLMLPVLLEQLRDLPAGHVTLFNATGTHRENTPEELRGMLGADIVRIYRIVQNDCRARDAHSLVGTTRSGNDIWIHRDYLACDLRILTGFIEPHFFAGFSGGGKAVMPGLARLDTVLRNHKAGHLDDPRATWGVTAGNPLWEEIHQVAALTKPSFLWNVTLNRDKQITGVFAGDLEQAHARGCAVVRQHAMVPVAAPFDIVITSNSGYPLDLNLYQAIKGISAAFQVVKPGGSIISAVHCWDGIPDHGQYGRLLQEAESIASLLETIRAPGFSRQDMWQAQIHALVCSQADVYVYSENLTAEQIRGAMLKPAPSVEATLGALLAKYGRNASICVLPEGPQTIPYVQSAGS